MPEKPIMHGRDHRPGGTDPIPGLDQPWGFLYAGANLTVAADGTYYYQSIQDGVSGAVFGTSDSSVFANQQSTLSRHSVFPYGLSITAAGTYVCLYQCTYSLGTSGVTMHIDQTTDDGYTFGLVFGSTGGPAGSGGGIGIDVTLTGSSSESTATWGTVQSFPAANVPAISACEATIPSGSSAHVRFGMFFWRINSTDTTFL